MVARIVVVAALLALPLAAAAQNAPRKPLPTPPSHRPPSHHHHGNTGRFTPAVVINANDYIATPNPHKTPFHNTTHNTIPPGQDVFSSQSSDGK